MTRAGLESGMTAALFVANASIIITLLVAFVARASYEKCHPTCRTVARKIRAGPQAEAEAGRTYEMNVATNGAVAQGLNPLLFVDRGRRPAADDADAVVGGFATDAPAAAADAVPNAALAAAESNAQLAAEIVQLKAENAQLKAERQGAVREIEAMQHDDEGAAADVADAGAAPDAAFAAIDTAEAASADDEEWYYEDANDATAFHGPYSLHQLKEWCDEEHFTHDMEMHRGSAASDAITLGMAFYSADLLPDDEAWFYGDGDDASKRHGPHTLAALGEWLEGGQLDGATLVRDGVDGERVALTEALAAMERGTAARKRVEKRGPGIEV